MSTRWLPAETPGAQGLAGFPRGSPSTLPSTHFFAPIPETPAIAAKIFEISENVWGYDILTQDEKLDRDRLDELVELMVDTVCSNREMIRIAGDDYPAEVVKSRFLKIDSSHIEYVLERMRENTTYVRNIKKYLLAALYNAPVTMDSYYTSLVSHDLYGSGDRR